MSTFSGWLTYSFGFDVNPPELKWLQVSASYFNVDYRNRIANPVEVLPASEANYPQDVFLNPTAAQVQQFLTVPGADAIQNYSGKPWNPATQSLLAAIPNLAIVDDRSVNVASELERGIDLSLKTKHDIAYGSLMFNVDGTYTLRHTVRDTPGSTALSVIDQVGLPAPSMGGALLQDFVLAHPDRVSALVLSDVFARNEPPLGISDSVRKRIDGYGDAAANRRVFEANMPRYFDAANFTSADMEAFVAEACKASNMALQGLLAEEYTIPAIPVERYRQIAVPTLIMVGAHDAFVPFKQVATLTDAIPGVRLTVVIPRAGHTPMWE